jgi:hypothetical protein
MLSESSRLVASTLYRITEADLNRAIEDFKSGTSSHNFADSTRFDLLSDQERYPPKAIVGLAAQAALGRVFRPADFSGGESSSAFRLLLDRGFEIATKLRAVGTVDAAFSVSRRIDGDYLIVESRGPNRNTEYDAGLEVLLANLADLDGILLDAVIDSKRTRHLSIDERRLVLEQWPYAIRLRQIADLADLRRALTSSAARTARTPDATGGGNPTKRLRLQIQIPAELGLHGLAELLAEGASAVSGQGLRQREPNFGFDPRPPVQSGEDRVRKAIDPAVVTHVHVQLQDALYAGLVQAHGRENVAAEHITSSGRPADLLVRREDGFDIYEIKTALSARDCIRQAIGQLLEYAYWPGSPPARRLWIVGPSAIDAETEEYLNTVRDRFGIELHYLHQVPPAP